MALKKKLRGSTLIETMIAMVIISMSLGIGSLTISGVLESSDSHRATEARLGSFGKETLDSSRYKLTVKEVDYEDVPALIVQTRIIIDEAGKELFSEKKLVQKPK